MTKEAKALEVAMAFVAKVKEGKWNSPFGYAAKECEEEVAAILNPPRYVVEEVAQNNLRANGLRWCVVDIRNSTAYYWATDGSRAFLIARLLNDAEGK